MESNGAWESHLLDQKNRSHVCNPSAKARRYLRRLRAPAVQPQMRKYALVAIGGGLGTLLRFAVGQSMFGMPGGPPLSVLFINVSGCFLISFLNFLSDRAGKIYLGPNSRAFLMVGVCGGYTTFSTFSLISFNDLRHGAAIDLWLNIGLSHLLCLLAIRAGGIVASGFPQALATITGWLRS
jgi:fluoride exporter